MPNELVFALVTVPVIVILIAVLDAFERVARRKHRERQAAAAARCKQKKPDF